MALLTGLLRFTISPDLRLRLCSLEGRGGDGAASGDAWPGGTEEDSHSICRELITSVTFSITASGVWGGWG